MKKFFTNKFVLFFLGIIAMILGWFLLSEIFDIESMIFPGPIETIEEVFNLLKLRSTYKAIWFSVVRLFIGFAVSLILAFVLALIVNDSKARYEFVNPLITFFKCVPTATFVFLFVILSGIKNGSVFVVVTITFPILYESFVASFQSTNKTILEATLIDGSNKLNSLFAIQLPMGIPFIVLGIISSFSLSFKVEVMAEVIMGYTNGGIGSMIKNAQLIDPTNLTTMFAYSFIAVVFMLGFSFLTNIAKEKIAKNYIKNN